MELDLPLISIIIPVYNGGQYLEQTVKSLFNQTFGRIEIICVDDNSTDNTPAILRALSEIDERLKIIRFDENKTASQARKAGVLAAVGGYIMFVDADDTLDDTACGVLYELAEKSGVDMIQFDAEIVNCTGLPQGRIDAMTRLVKPYDGSLAADNLIKLCFSDKKFNFNLWGKLYRAEPCKMAFSRVEDRPFPKAQDLYAFFLIAYFTKTYLGVPDRYYHYFFGRGNTGHSSMGMERFEFFCTMSLIAPAIERFLTAEDALHLYDDITAGIHERLFYDCWTQWRNALAPDMTSDGFELMVKYWGLDTVVLELAKRNWYNRAEMAGLLCDVNAFKPRPRKIRTIATYYHTAANGGVQRVNAILIRLWIEMGYKVVLITDTPPTPGDYELPESVTRIVIPDYQQHTARNYSARFEAFSSVIADYAVDAVVYHAWLSTSTFWDMLTVKSRGCMFIMHCHNIFTVPLATNNPYGGEIPYIYRYFDAVMALSRVDQAWWRNFNDNVVFCVNPMVFDLEEAEPSPLNEPNILWVGRMAKEKNPMHVLQIMEQVLQAAPNAKLHICGGGEPYFSQMTQEIEKRGLTGSVFTYGYTNDVSTFYKNASVYLLTSDYEGFSMTLLESKSYGLPCVCYEMPYLEFSRDGRGMIPVPTGDIRAAAMKIIRLLDNDELRRKLGGEARASAVDQAKTDIGRIWRKTFSNLENGLTETEQPTAETYELLFQTLASHTGMLRKFQLQSNETIRKQTASISELKKQIETKTEEAAALIKSNSERQDHAIGERTRARDGTDEGGGAQVEARGDAGEYKQRAEILERELGKIERSRAYRFARALSVILKR